MLHVSIYMFMQTRISELYSEIYRSPLSILNPSKFSHYFSFYFINEHILCVENHEILLRIDYSDYYWVGCAGYKLR